LLAAFLSGYAVNRWKGRQDHIEKRFDELVTTVLDTADLASEYWSKDAQAAGVALCEAKIRAQLIKIAGFRVLLTDHVSASAAREMERAESLFIRQTTGGQFGVHNRVPEMQRIVGCQFSASELTVAIRRARLHDLKGFLTRR
jgi:hypothetical protein